MKLYGALEAAALESLTADPTTNVAGRIYWNSTTAQAMLDNGTTKRALLRNDGKAIFGTDATAANNIRLHHAGQAYLQFVTGDDTTAENVISTKLAQVGIRVANFTTAALPALGNLGRLVFDSTLNALEVDNGTIFSQLATLTGAETLSNKTLVSPIADVVSFTDQTNDPAASPGVTKLYTKNGAPYKLGADGLVTLIGSGGGSGGFNYLPNGDFEAGITTVTPAKTAVTNGLPSGTGPTIG